MSLFQRLPLVSTTCKKEEHIRNWLSSVYETWRLYLDHQELVLRVHTLWLCLLGGSLL